MSIGRPALADAEKPAILPDNVIQDIYCTVESSLNNNRGFPLDRTKAIA